MSKIELTDNAQSMVVKMSDGNPGAVACLVDTLKRAKEIDPMDAFAPFGPILSLDSMGIYGSSIYVLWSDKCKRNTRLVLMLLRACQLGFLSPQRIKDMAADQSRTVNMSETEFTELDQKVCDRLPEFERPDVPEPAA